jgi:DNA polymerase
MSSEREQLVEAAIGHLNRLRASGRRFISLAPETLEALAKAPEFTGPPSSPRPVGTIPSAESSRPLPASTPSPVSKTEEAIATSAVNKAAATPAPSRSTVGPSLNKVEALKELRERALVCMKCANLAAARTNVVFGVGSVDAQLMFVGEAPGADEDRQGEPFVGAAGQLLNRIIQTMGLSRETVYIANILKCRPDTPGQSSGNRKPTPDEMRTCIPYLHSQIDIIQPKALVALGATAVEGLLGQAGGITKLRGNWQEYRGIPLMPTFHPAYLLRNMALSEKRKVWEDMLLVMEKLNMPISEKQRGFFLIKT